MSWGLRMAGEAASPETAAGMSPKEILFWVFHRWKLLLAATLGAGLVAAGISLLIPRTYQATAMLRPIQFDDSGVLLQGSTATSIGGTLASSLLGGARQADAASIVIVMAQSPDFVRNFIAKFKIGGELFPNDWDQAAGRWKKPSPMLDERAVSSFQSRITINQDQNGLIDLKLRWSSPARAEEIERLFITEINNKEKSLTRSKAEANLAYLQKRLQRETIEEMRMTTASLAGKQLAQIMLSQGPGDYAVEVVAPPYASQFPIAPARKLITIMGAIIGFVGMALFLLALQAWKRS